VVLADDPSDAGIARALAADRAGFDRFHLADLGMDGRDQWPVLGVLAARTERIRLGLVTNPYTRLPAVTANAVRTLDELSGGRAFVVLARGGERILSGASARADEPLRRVGTALELLAKHAPGVETWVATKGPKMMRLAVAAADGVLLSGVPHSLLPGLAARLRREAGRPLRVAVSIAYGGARGAPTPEARTRVALELGNMRAEYRDAAGVDPRLIERVRAVLFGGGTLKQAAALVPDELIPRFTLVADRGELTDRLAAFRADSAVDLVELSASAAFGADGAPLLPGSGGTAPAGPR
jgi:5,10-methylenetetrahydromethanopterin reductase